MNRNTYLTILKNRNYFKYISGQIISKMGDIIFRLALTWLLVEKTNSAKMIGVMLFVTYIPQYLLGLVGGYIIDRFDRRHIMILSDFISGTAVLIFFVLINLGYFSAYAVFVVVFILAAMDVIYSPATRAFIPSIIANDELLTANSLYNGVSEVIKIVGNGIAGILVIAFGLKWIFLFNSLTYFFSAFMISLIKLNNKNDSVGGGLAFNLPNLFDGLKYIKKDKYVASFLFLLTICNITYGVIFTLPSIYSKNILNSGVEGFGLIQAGLSLGMLLGVSIIGNIKIKKAGILFLIGLLSGGVTLVILGLNQVALIAVIIYFVFGICDSLTIPSFTYLQLHVNDEIRGRVFSIFDTIVLSAVPIAALIVGYLTDIFGVQTIYKISGILLILVSLIGYKFRTFRESNLNDVSGETVST